MYRCSLVLLALLCVLSPASARGDNNINVAVVFSSDANLSVSEKFALTAAIQVEMSLVLSNSQMTNRTVTFVPMVTDLSYNATQKKSHEANLWLKDENADIGSTTYFARNFLTSGGADLILMVVDHWTSSSCGTTAQSEFFDSSNPLPPLSISLAESEEFAFAAYAINSPPQCRREITIPHEVGHLLYAEHESIGNVDNNNDINLPSFDNHGITLGNGANSIMRGDTDTQTSQSYSGVAGLTGPWAHVNTFIVNKSWNTVSKYRAPPATPSVAWFFIGCWAGKAPQVEVSWWPGSGGGLVDDFVVQQYAYGSWQPWYDGYPGCINTTVSQQGTQFRVKAVNTVGESIWAYFTAFGFCENF